MRFNAGDRVKVEYQYGKFYTGQVLWTKDYGGLHWVTVRPDDIKFIYTFGSATDMDLGYKSYIADDVVLSVVSPA